MEEEAEAGEACSTKKENFSFQNSPFCNQLMRSSGFSMDGITFLSVRVRRFQRGKLSKTSAKVV